MTNKVHLTIRLDPKLLAYIKQQAPDNMSRFVEELVRKHAADNVQDDTLARLKRAIISDNDFLNAVAGKIGAPTSYSPSAIQNLADTDPQDNWNKRYDPKRPFWSPFGPLPIKQVSPMAVCDPNYDDELNLPLDVTERNAWLERE